MTIRARTLPGVGPVVALAFMAAIEHCTDVGKNHDLAVAQATPAATNHLTQQPYVKNQAAQ
jgi:hypothetical protein